MKVWRHWHCSPHHVSVSSFFFFSSRRRHTRYIGDWSSDVCSSDLLPTFYRETARVDEAGTVDTLLDQETTNIKVRPFPGRLYTISGNIMTNPQGSTATVTLVSDVSRETLTTTGAFQFVSKPPGP